MGHRGFGSLTPKEIYEKLLHLYGKLSLSELENALLKLHDPMYRTLPVEVMLCGIEEIKMFLLVSTDKERELTEVIMISYRLINMVNPGIYGNTIESWNNPPASDRKKWLD